VPITTQAKLDKAIDLISRGSSMKAAMKEVGLGIGTLYDALGASQALRDRYARASTLKLEVLASDVQDIPDSVGTGLGAVAKARLQVDSRKWLLAKLAPKKYGERTIHEGDPDNPVKVTINVIPVSVSPRPKEIDHDSQE